MGTSLKCSFLIFLAVISARAQIAAGYIAADPYPLTEIERHGFSNAVSGPNLDLRPLIPNGPDQGFTTVAYLQSYLYHNDNAPNLENTAELFVGKGWTTFSSVHLELSHKYLFFSTEPFFQHSTNDAFAYYHISYDPDRAGELERKFHVLNDGPGRGEGTLNELRFRETQFYVNWKGLGAGVSNSGMWWGPGIHTSLNMTTNTSGLPRVVLGTLREQKIKNLGLVGQYIFSELDRNITDPYYTAILGSITYYSDPIITLGGSRTFLSGGNLVETPVSWQDAALLPFQPLRKEKLYNEATAENPSDRTDQTIALFLSMIFPESRLKIFLEYGWNDHRWDWYDLRAEPDHSGASIIGFRKYGLFGKADLFLGFEYANLMKSPYYPQRGSPDWYGRRFFDYGTYDGRRFAAHSGSDSDDMLLYLGLARDDYGVNLGFNYERHGKIYSNLLLEFSSAGRFPEDKLELRLDYWKQIKLGKIFAYYEYEFTENLGSPPQGVFPRVENPERKANVIGLGFRSNLLNY